MEQKATGADQEVTDKGDKKHGVMAVFSAVEDTFKGQEDEHKICQGIDDFSGVRGGIVVLGAFS